MANEVVCRDVFAFLAAARNAGMRYPLVLADPPYGRVTKESWDRDWDARSYLDLARAIEAVLEPGGCAYVWGGVGRYRDRQWFRFLADVETETSLRLHANIVWSKRRAYGVSHNYLFTREELACLCAGEKPATFHVPLLSEKRGYAGYDPKYPAKSEYLRRTMVWSDITELFRDKTHPCEKPVALSRIPIETHTEPDAWILDLFSGSGSASVAARELGRNSIAVEADPSYCDVIARRLSHG